MNTTTTIITMIQDDGGDDGSNRCELLGPFALFIQAALGGLALLSLVWKRSRESPQRPLRIWWFDVSKQVVGSILVHIANIVLSMLSSGTFGTEPSPAGIPPPPGFGPPPPGFGPPPNRRDFGGPPEDDPTYHPNPCSFYLLNLAIDTTIGIAILIFILRMLHTLLALSPFSFFKTGISSGDYGEPPKWSYWIKQAIIYFMGLMGMKFIVWIIFALCPWLGHVGDWLLAWTEGDKRLQVFFVMFFFPLVMNALQYYIIDSYIKKKIDPSNSAIQESAPVPGRAGSSLSSHRRSFDSAGDIFNSDDEEANTDSRSLLRPSSHRSRGTDKKLVTPVLEEYNPDTDGSTLQDGLGTPRSNSPSSSYNALRSGRRSLGSRKRSNVPESSKSRNSSMMLLPGSRGPSTPGYGEEESIVRGFGGRRGSDDDETTLVGKDEDLERGGR